MKSNTTHPARFRFTVLALASLFAAIPSLLATDRPNPPAIKMAPAAAGLPALPSVVRAETHEAAARMFENHPHFAIFPGDSVEIMECLPIPTSH